MSSLASYGRSPDDYIRESRERSGGSLVPMRAEGSAPENVMGRDVFGEDLFLELFQPNNASSADAAAKISAVYFCVSLIAEAVGNCPIEFFEGGHKVEGFDVADAIANGPNPVQTAAEFWPSMLFRAALAGHAFAEPVVQNDELLLWALHPDRILVDWRERGFTVHYTPEGAAASRLFNASQLFWISGIADARMQPLTPWKMARGALDFALALENQGRRFFQNHKRLPGVLYSDVKLDEDVIPRIERGVRRWKDGHIPVLEQGLKWQQAGANNTDSQFVELLDQRTHEMARYWRIPRSFYAESANAKSAEQEAQGFVKWTARPWARRVEQAIRQRLLTPDQRKRIKVQMNLDALLRGDSATQWKNAVLARTASILSVDEIREDWFGKAPIGEAWSKDARAPLNSNRAADTITGGQTAPQDANEEDRDQ